MNLIQQKIITGLRDCAPDFSDDLVNLPRVVEQSDHWIYRWWFAAKPKSWGKLLVPALFGQSLGVVSAGRVDGAACAYGLGLTVANLLCIVFLNDYGDREIDSGKRKMFPQAGSKKTIPDGILPASALLWAGWGAIAAMFVLSWWANQQLGRPALLLYFFCAVLSIWAYTFAPFRVNYRGGGELIEALGVGLCVPWMQFYLQSGNLSLEVLALSPALLLWSSASAIASGISDEISDRSGGKVTVVTIFGNELSRRWIESLMFAGIVLWALLAIYTGSWILKFAVCVSLVHWLWLRRSSELAVTMAFDQHGPYKALLHHGIWRPQLILSLGMLASFFLPP